MALTKKAVRRLEAVIECIKEEPKRLSMADWGTVYNIKSKNFKEQAREDDLPKCGTVACIAGWVVLLENRKKRLTAARKAAEKNGSSHSPDDLDILACEFMDMDMETGGKLFFTGSWPDPFSGQYEEADTARGRMKATVDRIKHFIKTDGEE